MFDYEGESFREEGTSFESDEDLEHLKLLPYFDFYSDLIRKNFRYLPLVIEFHITSEQSKLNKRSLKASVNAIIENYFQIEENAFIYKTKVP